MLEKYHKDEDVITMWQAVDLNGDVFWYHDRPVWDDGHCVWVCPYVDRDVNPIYTIRPLVPILGQTAYDEPIELKVKYEDYLRYLTKYRG